MTIEIFHRAAAESEALTKVGTFVVGGVDVPDALSLAWKLTSAPDWPKQDTVTPEPGARRPTVEGDAMLVTLDDKTLAAFRCAAEGFLPADPAALGIEVFAVECAYPGASPSLVAGDDGTKLFRTMKDAGEVAALLNSPCGSLFRYRAVPR